MILAILIFMFATMYETYFSKENRKVRHTVIKDNKTMMPKEYSVTALLVNDTIVDAKILGRRGEECELHDFGDYYGDYNYYLFTSYGLNIMKRRLEYIVTPVRPNSYYGRMVSYIAERNKGSEKINSAKVYHFRANKNELRELANVFSKETLIESVDFIYA